MVAASAEVLKAINSPRTTRIERIRLLRWVNVYEVNRLSRGELGSRTSRRSVTDHVCCTDRFPNVQRFTVIHIVGTMRHVPKDHLGLICKVFLRKPLGDFPQMFEKLE
jgi:hypothetical protein